MKGVKKTSLFALFLHLGLHESYALISLRPRGRNIPCRGSLEVVPKSRANDRYSISEYNFDRTKRSPRKRPHGRRRAPGFSHEKKVARQRPAWLQQATENILATKPGSLNKGKWHELTSMIKAWSKFSKDDVEAPIVIEKLLKRLLDERKAGVDEAKADIRLYNILLDAWACSAIFRTRVPEIASQRAREILVLLQENFEREKDLDIQPNEESFALVFHVVCKMEGPVKARRVLAWMEYIYKVERNIYAKPTKKHYFTLLNTYANSRDGNAGKLVEGFIRHMKMMGVSPDTFCYNIAIKAWMKAKRGRESAEHADRILEEMDVPKDLVTYSTVISAWAASGMKSHAVSRAEELLRDIEESEDLEPNTVVLNTVMSTWVKSRNPGAVNRTEELLRRMESSESCPPDLISYNTHIHSLSIHAKRDGYAQRAHNLLISLEDRYKKKQISYRPNLFTYNLVIDAWSRSQDYDAAWNAVKVLRKLIDEDGPNPDTFSFNQVLSALSRSSKPGAARLAERLLDYMEDAYKMKMYRDAKPDVIGYTSVIITLGRSGEGDAAERAEKILERMKAGYAVGETYMKPNRMTYNSLIDCWAKSGQGTFAARKAEALLKEMDEMAMRDSSIAPNIITYNAVLNSWARSGTRCCGNKAEEYLDRMWELHNGGDGNMAPNGFSFNTVINAISKSQNKGKAQKTLRILRRMDKLYQAGYKNARPDEVTYTSVLNSCAFPATLDRKTRRKALDTAIFTLRELRSSRYGQPNEVTYGTFIQACANLLSDDDEMLRAVIEEAFQQACKDGQVGQMVLTRLRDAAPEGLYEELLAKVSNSPTPSVSDLPLEWRCNLREEKKRGRRDRPLSRGGNVSQKTKPNAIANKKIAP